MNLLRTRTAVACQRNSDGSVYGAVAKELPRITAVLLGEGKEPDSFFKREGD